MWPYQWKTNVCCLIFISIYLFKITFDNSLTSKMNVMDFRRSDQRCVLIHCNLSGSFYCPQFYKFLDSEINDEYLMWCAMFKVCFSEQMILLYPRFYLIKQFRVIETALMYRLKVRCHEMVADSANFNRAFTWQYIFFMFHKKITVNFIVHLKNSWALITIKLSISFNGSF